MIFNYKMFDMKEYRKEYNKSAKGKKCKTISSWKRKGLKETKEFMEQIYDEYLKSEECELCGEPYLNGNFKSMDHCHKTGEFRNIVCNRCNQWKLDRVGKNIYWNKDANKYVVQIKRNYKHVLHKYCNTEEKCKEILNQFILDNPHYFT